MRSLDKRIKTSLDVIKLNNLNLITDLKIVNDCVNFKDRIKSDYNIKYKQKEEKSYNSELEEEFGSINNIDDDKNLTKFIDIKFYGENLGSKFISNNVLINIINNLFFKTEIRMKNRIINIFSKSKVKNSFIDKIISVFDFFDTITNTKNRYVLDIYLSKNRKLININDDTLKPDNINSGLTAPGFYIVLFRKEEVIKLLFHELVHYLHLDMILYQNKFKKLYNDINLKASIVNPNEAYTELLAILFMSIWKYYYFDYKEYYDLNTYISKTLTVELGWSYYQISKILKFFKCYDSYEDLFTNNCEFRQDSNVLSYYFLKTYFLQNINIILKNMSLKNLRISENESDYILNNTNLKDDTFVNNINKVIELNQDIYDNKSLRMTCLD